MIYPTTSTNTLAQLASTGSQTWASLGWGEGNEVLIPCIQATAPNNPGPLPLCWAQLNQYLLDVRYYTNCGGTE